MMLDCPAGYYCKNGGASTENQIDGGQIKICDSGYYCPSGSIDQIPCHTGSYNPDKQQSVCRVCPEGFQCETMGMKQPDNCQTGSYCPIGTMISVSSFTQSRLPCPAGTYNDKTNLKSSTECA